MERTSDSRRFRQLIEMLAAGLRGELSTPLIEAYWQALEDFPLSAVDEAVKRALRESGRFMPTTGELRQLVREAERKQGTFPTVEDQRRTREAIDAEKKRIWQTWQNRELEPGKDPDGSGPKPDSSG